MDIYWDDYYRGVKEGYFTEAQRVKIESLLKAYPLESKERRDNFNTFFLNNIERIIPAQSLILNLEVQLGNKLRSYIFKSVTETEIILENLKWLNYVYFRWQYRRFPDPLDNYKWLSESKSFLIGILTRDLPDPLSNPMIVALIADLDILCKNIYRIGELHSFIHKGNNFDES